ncbi:DUF1415 domain-containing protein [Legionella sp. km772]|uniref:DUF1415 domain-containing protein n=1 Tax=Legionella sp. km772 TaxID=2498111 RepID=UPI000F8F0BEF|nr:DUF1415 domain-containing protein [Legionella sp. km772]RUR13747.1 DUF1415 domain-containing protein [Legionella sp. km772]
MNSTTVTEQTLNWVRSFVIENNLCPFAKGPVNKNALRITVSEHRKKALALEDLMTEIHFLDEHPKIETTLLVFPTGFKDFFAYLELVDLAEELLEQLEYEGIYQVASFHPDYYFADSEPDEVSNYTNRSPYPMLHILREEDLEKAIQAYGDTSKIPERNRELLQHLGLEKIKEILK